MHDSRPKRCRTLNRKRVTHRAAVSISNPDGYGMLLIESTVHASRKPLLVPVWRRFVVERQRGIYAEALFARFVIAQNVGDDFRRGGRGDARDWIKFGGEQFWSGGPSAAARPA